MFGLARSASDFWIASDQSKFGYSSHKRIKTRTRCCGRYIARHKQTTSMPSLSSTKSRKTSGGYSKLHLASSGWRTFGSSTSRRTPFSVNSIPAIVSRSYHRFRTSSFHLRISPWMVVGELLGQQIAHTVINDESASTTKLRAKRALCRPDDLSRFQQRKLLPGLQVLWRAYPHAADATRAMGSIRCS